MSLSEDVPWKQIIYDAGKMRIFVHSGHLSLDNGARYPLIFFHELVDACGAERESGYDYYDDSMIIDRKDLSAVLEMINENNMLYWIPGQHEFHAWQGAKTEKVKQILNRKATL